ncbi:hypothetical protein MKEN_01270600 [Mycena kentingensis (nom. inval.)]|nr:hypothetical protein MKEN_01270600 [Mycena kentingensis (nom. inval.)]
MAPILSRIDFLLSWIDNTFVHYIVLGALILYACRALARYNLPHTCLTDLEHIIGETDDILQKAREARALNDIHFRVQAQFNLSQLQERASLLRLEALTQHGVLSCATEYFYVFGNLSKRIRVCRGEVKQLQLTILKEIESEKSARHAEEATGMAVVLACSSRAGRRSYASEVSHAG